MGKLSGEALQLFREAGVWILSTCQDQPNAAPIFFKTINEQGELILFDVFMNKNLANLKANPKVSVVAFDPKTLQGYQVKGTARYTTDQAMMEAGNTQASKMGLAVKGTIIVMPDEIYVQTPGPEVGKLL